MSRVPRVIAVGMGAKGLGSCVRHCEGDNAIHRCVGTLVKLINRYTVDIRKTRSSRFSSEFYCHKRFLWYSGADADAFGCLMDHILAVAYRAQAFCEIYERVQGLTEGEIDGQLWLC